MRTLQRMTQKRLILSLLCLSVLTAAAFAACTSSQSGDPAAAVEAYLTAMVANDTAKLPQLICPAFEAGARTDFDSFGAINGVTLKDMHCTAGAVNGDSTMVTCTGSIDFQYNGESNSQDLSQDNYLTQQVDGEWKMCGYQ